MKIIQSSIPNTMLRQHSAMFLITTAKSSQSSSNYLVNFVPTFSAGRLIINKFLAVILMSYLTIIIISLSRFVFLSKIKSRYIAKAQFYFLIFLTSVNCKKNSCYDPHKLSQFLSFQSYTNSSKPHHSVRKPNEKSCFIHQTNPTCPLLYQAS